jgi:hypothetical protein
MVANSHEFTPLLQAMERFIEKSVMRDKRIEELKEIIPMKQKNADEKTVIEALGPSEELQGSNVF